MHKIMTLLFGLIFFVSNQILAQENSNKLECFSFLLAEKETGVSEVLDKIDAFSYNDCENFNFGINKQVAWIKISTEEFSSYSSPILVLNSASIDFVFLFPVSGSAIGKEQVSGRMTGIENRYFQSHKIVFQLTEEELAADFLLLKIENTDKKIFTAYVTEDVEFKDIIDFEM